MARLTLFFLLAALGWSVSCPAQEVFLDVNRDGRCDAADVLGPEVASVDVWFVTDRNADGSAATCQGEWDREYSLSVFSFMVLLRAWGDGTVRYGPWIPGSAVSGFQADLGSRTKGADCVIAYGGMNALEPGRYKVGTLRVAVTGHPRLSFMTAAPLAPELVTCFGSECPGLGFDSTIRLGGEFIDARGTAAATSTADAGSVWAAVQKLYR